ncbi:hypothetical protein RQP50_18635 [Paenibacillus sp. chi10]|uniref:Uncharacterized protein n=1 Tax=Paenibacillus suaedae TaxID=3077233 RepID=A0AAJ2K183_9BACL|nr:hypothetical protein [Paenibacillus sp. chi10]MDT8978247.1 hypothetical protein [Paenibacillus sp. chi10]
MTTLYSDLRTNANVKHSISTLQHLLASLTQQEVITCHLPFIEHTLYPEHSIFIYTEQQLNHPESPFRLKRKLQEDEVVIAYLESRGLLVAAGSESALSTACLKLGSLFEEQCAVQPQAARPRLKGILCQGVSHDAHPRAI